jgi:hypothetical protein
LSKSRGIPLPLIAITFVVTAAIYIIKTVTGGKDIPLINDTDDAMRLVEVRDLLNGQGWYDTMQYRLNVPFGADMHWSRLVDAPIAGLIWVLKPLLGDNAELAAAYIWPLLLLAVLLWLAALVSKELAGREAVLPGVVLTAVSTITLGEFSPGRFDHHSVQVLLALATALCALKALQQPRYGLGAALCASAAIAVGVEALPVAVAAIAAFGLMWVIEHHRAVALRWFGIGLIGSSILLTLALVSPDRWFAVYCDANSIVYVTLFVSAGLLLTLISLLPLNTPWARLGAGVVCGGIVVALFALLFPDCLKGPYAALDPWLVKNWLSEIDEARPLLYLLFNDPVYLAGTGIPVLLGSIFVANRLVSTRGEERWRWLVYGLFLLLAALIMLLQIRATRTATILALPAGAALVALVRSYYLERQKLLPALGLIGSWLGFSGIILALSTSMLMDAMPGKAQPVAANTDDGQSCRSPEAFTALAKLPATAVMTPVDLGAHVLLFNLHSVVAAPYHRNQDGVRDAFRFFNDPIDEARQILTARNISLVVICPGLPEMRGLNDAAADSFVKLLARDQLPDWLVETSPAGSTLRVFSVSGS